MCILCQGRWANEFDVEHMKIALKKLSIQEKKNKAIDIKVALQLAEKYGDGNKLTAIAHLKEAQYLLSQFM